ncbi:MAG: class II aldolase [Oscillospiraceae bacterium]|nr:class II aldolase [Oscillospiraceae bacterium]
MKQLVAFSNFYGADPELVVAGGGNTSMKENGVLYVKGSGTALASIRAEEFVALDMAKLMKITEKTYPDEDAAREAEFLADILSARLPGEEHKRPSVETLLHALFPQRYVLHLHPNKVNGLTCSQNGEAEARRLFPQAAWIEECRPGYILAMKVREKILQGADTVLLQNHGVFFAADTPERLGAMLQDMLTKLDGAIAAGYDPALDTEPSLKGPFTPDHIVYCGLGPDLPDTDVARQSWASARKIAHYAASFGGQKPMSEDMIQFITHWEAESYRRKQA